MKIDEKDDIYNFSNFLLRLKNDFPFENYELYNLKKIEEHFEKNIDFDKLKRFMKKILRSRLYEIKYKENVRIFYLFVAKFTIIA